MTDTYVDLTVNKNDDEFFIAICNRGEHSYISFGAKSKYGDKQILGCFGKGFLQKYPEECLPKLGFHFTGAFSYYDSILKSEKWSFGDEGEREFNYKAYAITYDQYMQFLAYMRKVSQKQNESRKKVGLGPMRAYAPNPEVEEDQEGNIHLSYQNLPCDPEAENLIIEDYSKLSVGDTCRNTAIQLTEKVRKTSDLGSGVWSFFYKSLPLVASVLSGRINSPYFYILPLPPTAFETDDPEKLIILNELYQRLDEIAMIAPDNPSTYEKFQEIKKLYQEIAGKPKNEGIFAVIHVIEAWEAHHKALIETHRLSHFFSFKTATEKMFIRLHERFDRIKEKVHLELDAHNTNDKLSI